MTEHLDITVLSTHLDNELELNEHDHASRHLHSCPDCRARLAELQAMSQGLQALACAPAQAELNSRLEALFGQPVATPRRRRWAYGSLSAAASIMLGLFIGNALSNQPAMVPAEYNLLAVLGSTPPGALCARPEFCYLKVNLK